MNIKWVMTQKDKEHTVINRTQFGSNYWLELVYDTFESQKNKDHLLTSLIYYTIDANVRTFRF